MARGRARDVLLFAGVAALVIAAAVDAVRARTPGSEAHRQRSVVAQAPSVAGPPAAVPPLVALRGSPETAFLPDCRRGDVELSIARGGTRLVLRRSGGRCHIPALHFEATVRARSGALLYRGPALAREGLEGANLAGPATVSAALLPGLLRCDVQGPVRIVIRGAGLSTSGATHCRGSL